MQIKFEFNALKNKTKSPIEFLSMDEISKARNFHRSFSEYQPTPLTELSSLAKSLGVANIYVKDESYRFGLNAFKVLGGSYAIGRILAKKLKKDISELPYNIMTSQKTKDSIGALTFATTTDGNHGRGIAWTANRLNQKAVVYMPKGSQEIRLKNIQALGAQAEITNLNYDDAVRLTAKKANENGWIIVQDTAWSGYTEIPTWIMQGYGTMALEAYEQLQQKGVNAPTHIFVQAGVGSLAGAVQGFFANVCKETPVTVIAEADKADCLYRSAVAKDGKPHTVSGDMKTIMAGLACGEPNYIGWNILRDNSTLFTSCPDWVAANGMRILGNPLNGDSKIISGESGAVPTGLLVELLSNPNMKDIREKLNLNANSNILVFSTEGDTDPEMYRKIVWYGKYTKC